MKINSCEITDFIIDSFSTLGKIYAPNHDLKLKAICNHCRVAITTKIELE